MSDPFDVLRNTSQRGAPDLDAIKGRARRIERRRRVAIASSCVVIAAVAVGGVVLRPGGGRTATNVAQSRTHTSDSASSNETTLKAAAPAAPSAATAQAGSAAQSYNAVAPTVSPAPQERATGGAAAAPAPAADKSSGALELTLSAQAAGPHMERFTLKACNPSSANVAPTFPTGQRYDFEVRRSGSLVWRWSDGMAFTMIYGQENWAPKQCKTYTATWNGTNASNAVQPTGAYQVTGILTSQPRQTTPPKSFCLDLC